MKKYYLFAMMLLLATACGKKEVDEPEPEPEPVVAELTIGNFNIRVDTASDTDYKDWDARKQNCATIFTRYGFDVLGLEEVLYNQRVDLKEMLPDYNFYFVGRDDGNAGEAVGIAYNPKTVEIQDWNRFWLSDTPDTPSSSLCWNGLSRKRVAVWILLKHRESEKEFYVAATHLEVGADYAEVRKKSAELIVERMKTVNTDNLPLFLVGDMNPSTDEEEALGVFRAAYHDAFRVAEEGGFREGPKATFQNFDPNRNLDSANSHPLDFIFYTEPVKLKAFAALTDKFDGYYPSDHLPIIAKVRW